MGSDELNREIEMGQLLNSQPTNSPRNRKDCRNKCNLIALLTIVIILILTGIGLFIYITRGDTTVCKFSRPSQILNHLMETNDYLIKEFVGHDNSGVPSQEYKAELKNSLNSINATLNKIRESIEDAEKDVKKLKGFDLISATADMDDVIAKLSGLQEQADWIGVAVTSKGPAIVKSSEYTRESFVDRKLCKVSRQDLDQLDKQFQIEIKISDGHPNVINLTALVVLNCSLKKFHGLLLKREAIYDEFVKEFDAHKSEDVGETIRNETLQRVLMDDGPPIPYFNGNSSIVDLLRESTRIIRREAISGKIIIQRPVHYYFDDIKIRLNSRQADIDKLILPVKRNVEDLYARLFLLAHDSTTFV